MREGALPTVLTVAGAALLLGAAAAGCGGGEPAPPPQGAAAPVHEHVAPHGGTLIELGEEFAHVELLLDRAAGSATAYVLDGEAEGPAAIAQPSLEIAGTVDGRPFSLTLSAVANPLTGETVGNTSEFRGRCEVLKGAASFKGALRTITVKGGTFGPVEFGWPGGNDAKGSAGGGTKGTGKGKE